MTSGLRQPFPCAALANAGSCSSVHSKHAAHLDVSDRAFQSSHLANFVFGKHDARRFTPLGSETLADRFSRIIHAGFPSKMIRIYASVATIATGMRRFVQGARRWSVCDLTHAVGRGGSLTVETQLAAPVWRSEERPFEAVITSVRSVACEPRNHRMTVEFRVWRTVEPVLLIMAAAKAACEMRAIAAFDRTCTLGVSHLNLFHRFGSARTRRGVPTPGGFATFTATSRRLQA